MAMSLSAWFIGESSLLIQCASAFAARGHRIAGIVSADPRVSVWASDEGLALVPSLANVELQETAPFDYLFSVVNLQMIGPEVLALPRRGAVNFHDGPLPAYAGVNAPAWALINGESQHGVTWHEMTKRADSGAILKQRLFPIPSGATSLELNVLCYEAALQAFEELIGEIETDRVQPIVQDPGQRSYFGKSRRPAAACVLRPEQSAAEVTGMVRALDFGPYPNPLGAPKLLVDDEAVIVTRAETLDGASGSSIHARAVHGEIVLTTATEDVTVSGLRTLEGLPIHPAEIEGLAPRVVPALPGETLERLEAADMAAATYEGYWVRRLALMEPAPMPGLSIGQPGSSSTIALLDLPHLDRLNFLRRTSQERKAVAVAAVGLAVSRLTGRNGFDLGFASDALRARVEGVYKFFTRYVPVQIDLLPGSTIGDFSAAMQSAVDRVERRGFFLRDLLARYPALEPLRGRGPSLGLQIIVDEYDAAGSYELAEGVQVALVCTPAGCFWVFDGRTVPGEAIDRLGSYTAAAFAAMMGDPSEPLETPVTAEPPAVPEVSGSDAPFLHELIEAQVSKTPAAVAALAGGERITYGELNARANQLARYLRRAGVGPETLVGISLARSIDLVVAVLAVLKAGGSYLPLDPAYPADRIRFMSTDAALGFVVTQSQFAGQFGHVPVVLTLDTQASVFDDELADNLPAVGDAAQLAYVIYTSGSSGTPKGVMIEHRNVVSFFEAMNERVPHSEGGVWLAVTSLSFDISVLELLWTLTRGFTVAIAPDADLRGSQTPVAVPPGPLDFSLFYFAADEGEPGNRYRLLLEGARFADQHGFAAVWTPERHFHAFGGLYPNPAVTGAAVAAITERVQIRAGSCVLPLHHPVRVAEEWSVVDNISQGRAGMSVATGWQPNDFILRPENFAARKEVMLRDLETVRRLWRGETIECDGPTGAPVPVRIFPRPVRQELPVWLTAAGNPETFAAAGESGAGVLTHLVGQTLDELAEKIAVYRASRQKAGHEGPGHVVLMLHTFVGESDEQVRELVRKPLCDYLRTSVNLIRPFASTFPTLKQQCDAGKSADEAFASLTEHDLEALVAHSFDRYVETGGLFGTPHTCLRTIARLKEIGVDEAACLIDFGVPADVVLAHLPFLDTLRQLSNAPAAEPETVPALITRHGVTHLQCTPSMATMLLLEQDGAAALGRLSALLVGGEALPASLARRLRDATSAAIVNMYGPTETTVWSATHQLGDIEDSIPIGRPIPGTELLVLDDGLRPVAPGEAGELYIGGPGVARGYLNRAQLTAERFVAHPFSGRTSDRVYKTGDLVRQRADGAFNFLGRTDFQVKVRGHRIELGEIESVLAAHPEVREAVVVAREDSSGDKRLVAYVVPHASAAPTAEALRAAVSNALPAFMVPSLVVLMERFPLTPNAKIDRAALPSPFAPDAEAQTEMGAEAGTSGTSEIGREGASMEAQVTQVWCEVLQVPRVRAGQNFFDLGGHSLLAAQVLARLKPLDATLTLTDLFRYPTVSTLAARLDRAAATSSDAARLAEPAAKGVDRVSMRHASLARRKAQRLGGPNGPQGDGRS